MIITQTTTLQKMQALVEITIQKTNANWAKYGDEHCGTPKFIFKNVCIDNNLTDDQIEEFKTAVDMAVSDGKLGHAPDSLRGLLYIVTQ